jgi:hypothetical protein
MIELLLFLILMVLVVKFAPGVGKFILGAIIWTCAILGAIILCVALFN